jgi:hypothetical protein
MKRHRIIWSRSWVAVCAGAFLLCSGFLEYSPVVHAESAARATAFPSSTQPDQVCLTWSGDPRTTQTIQWRTSPNLKKGTVQFREKSAQTNEYAEKTAEMAELEDPGTSNDPVNHRFTAVLDGLNPGATYTYRVGSKKGWSEWSEFTTAPQTVAPFSFIYLGDPQVGLDTWGRLLHSAYERHPEAAFYVVAGDIVNRGNNREEWDNLFHAASGVFDRRPFVPALGNHDCPGGVGPRLYLELLTLPQNGPKEIGPERAYRLDYGNALFLVLDSNLSPEAQRPWLEEQLQSTKAMWKFAVYHHPAYSSAPKRDNPSIREQWGSVFDQYHVDMALQGHDHGYLRTKPMRAGKEAASPAEGTVYVVSVSGTKHYEVEQHEYTAKSLAHLSTYQVIQIEIGTENTLTYRAYDMDGKLQDELIIVK